MTTDLTTRLERLILDQMDVSLNVQSIAPDTPLFEGGLGFDSFAIVELIGLIEDQFGFDFAEDDLKPESFVDLNTVAAVVARRIPAARS